MKPPRGSLTRLSWICGRTPIPIFQTTGKPRQSSQNCQVQKTRKPTSPDCAQRVCRLRKRREKLHTIPGTRSMLLWTQSGLVLRFLAVDLGQGTERSQNRRGTEQELQS